MTTETNHVSLGRRDDDHYGLSLHSKEYYISQLIREDPGFWGAALDKEPWLKMWNYGEKVQPKENTALLRKRRRKQEEEETVAESQ